VLVLGTQTVMVVVGISKKELLGVGPGPTMSDTTLGPPAEKLWPPLLLLEELLLELLEPLLLELLAPPLLDDELLDDPELLELPDEEELEPLLEELPLLDDDPGEEVFAKSSVSS
jgi:hypothetical protein